MDREKFVSDLSKALSRLLNEPTWEDAKGDPVLRVPSDVLKEAASILKEQGFGMLLAVVALDEGEEIRIAYPLFSFGLRVRLILMTNVSKENPEVPSLSDVWPAANWHEREQAELLGISFVGHPDLRHLLLPEDWEGYPLRKDYQQPKIYRGTPTERPYWEDGECPRTN